MKTSPFAPVRPSAALAARVSCVPYDTVSRAEARALIRDNPLSFLRISRPDADVGDEIAADDPALVDRAESTWRRYLAEGLLTRDANPGYFVYRQAMGGRAQTGIVACVHKGEFEANRVRRHELTRREKEEERVRHIQRLRCQPGLVFLTFRDDPAVAALMKQSMAEQPAIDFTAEDGVRHTVWPATDTAAMRAALDAVPVSYIADGHHRAAAGVRVANALGGEAEWIVTTLFPAGELYIMPYNRLVADLNGRTADQFLDALRKVATVTRDAPATPAAPRNASMYLGGMWYGLAWDMPGEPDPAARLDVAFLQNRVLDPLLGIKDPRTDKRIDFVGGIRGTGALMAAVDRGQAAVAFSMCPVSVYEMMDIADAGGIMPPKSTWFEPKLRSGLLIHAF